MRNKDVLVAGETIWERRREKSQGINVRLEMGPEADTTGSRNSWRGIVSCWES